MQFELTKQFLSDVSHAVSEKDSLFIIKNVNELHPADIAEIMDYVNLQEAQYIYQLLDEEQAADVLVEIDGEGLSSINPYKTFREVLKIKLKIKDLTIRNLILSIYVFLMNTIKRVIYDLLSKNPQFRKKLRLLVNSRIKG